MLIHLCDIYLTIQLLFLIYLAFSVLIVALTVTVTLLSDVRPFVERLGAASRGEDDSKDDYTPMILEDLLNVRLECPASRRSPSC